jgi:DNA-binding response OmpR family regulator
MKHGAKILLIEDDANMRFGLREALSAEGFTVLEAADGPRGLELFRTEAPNLVLLDIMLPKQSGYDVCREIRAKDARVPVIMLTAKQQEVDKVVGLELGADDYVTKPFGIRELVARIHAALRRAQSGAAKATELPKQMRFGEVVVNAERYELLVGKRREELTATELKLLAHFFQNAGKVLDRNAILNAVWGVEYYGTTRTLDQYVAKLRAKIERDPANPRHLITAHGVGYRFEV